MSLGTSESILVIILSILLAVFLTLSIVIAVTIIKLLKHIKNITEKAENIADKAEAVTSFFQHTTGPVAISKLISNIFNAYRENNERKKK